MVKKLFYLILLNLIFSQNVFADDFHKYYKQIPSYAIKSFNYENLDRLSLKVKIISEVSTKNNIKEGQKLVFLTTEDSVITHKKVLPAGSRVIGRVETVSNNEMIGIPANLIVGNFKIEYMPTIKLEGKINKQGSNRSLWIKPLMPVLFPIRGGHAKIKENEIYEIFYTPDSL